MEISKNADFPTTYTHLDLCACGQQFPWKEQVILVLGYVAEAAAS